jgi:pimeloyl-ACP methyl ester carboxylesterase
VEVPVHRLRLGDGRRLAWSEYGDPAGRPVLYCHGFPSSRQEARLLHPAAEALGARIIAPDRPGYGESDPLPDRTIAGWAQDLTALADHLGLVRFPLVGISGGGPYAAACTGLIPERLTACSLVCPLGPIYLEEVLEEMIWAVRVNFTAVRNAPQITRLLMGGPVAGVLSAWPQGVEHLRSLAAPPPDREELARPEVAAILDDTVRDAMRSGAPGALQDLVLYTQDWQIPFGPAGMPLRIWHGEDDATVPIAHGRWYARHLPGARAHWIPGEGHFSLPLRHGDEILRALLSDAAEVDGTPGPS